MYGVTGNFPSLGMAIPTGIGEKPLSLHCGDLRAYHHRTSTCSYLTLPHYPFPHPSHHSAQGRRSALLLQVVDLPAPNAHAPGRRANSRPCRQPSAASSSSLPPTPPQLTGFMRPGAFIQLGLLVSSTTCTLMGSFMERVVKVVSGFLRPLIPPLPSPQIWVVL